MDPRLHRETENLTKSWMQYDSAMLRDYLVAGVEDPRLNVQSILTRHFLLIALFGKRFDQLLEHELRFGLVLNWANAVFSRAAGREDLHALRHALARGADDAEGVPIPRFVSTAYSALPATVGPVVLPNYIDQFLEDSAEAGDELRVCAPVLSTFARAWADVLREEAPSSISVLEPACGSANDYRFMVEYGLARLLNYTGFDLCEKNARNAKELCPSGRFLVGNAFSMGFPDLTFDYALVHDLFEHLSIQAMELAVGELCRVTRTGLCLGFFNVHEGEEHIVQPTDDYHWNRLSLPKLRVLLSSHGFAAEAVHIDTFLRWRFASDQTHNKNAYTLFAERREDLG
jgi:SAM-dependent methyltransferase